MARAPSPAASRGAVNFRITADGSLSNKNMERYALFLADEVVAPDAWRAAGKSMSSGSLEYRKRVEGYEPFQTRLAQLRAEKEDLMRDDLFGEMKWMASQLWREARAKGDHAGAAKAAELRWKVLEKEIAFRDKDAPAAPAGRPGRPSVENPQTSAQMAEIRQRLVDIGLPDPSNDGAKQEAAPSATLPNAPPPPAVPEPGEDLADMLARAVPG